MQSDASAITGDPPQPAVFSLCKVVNEHSLAPIKIDCFQALWASHSFSSKCAIILQMFDENRDEILTLNKKLFSAVLRKYLKFNVVDNWMVYNAIKDMQYGAIPGVHSHPYWEDGEGGDPDAYQLYTFVTVLSHYSPASAEANNWCRDTASAVLGAFRGVMHE